MSAVAPKSFSQLRLFASFCAMAAGGWVGQAQKRENDALWQAHFRAQWAARAAAQEAAKPKVATEVPEIIPAELHGVYKELTGTH